jgi:hypothetical protein
LAILRHLAADANPQQLERLIAECIPRRFLELERAMEREDFFDDPDTLTRLRKAYRILFDGAPAEARGRSVAGFVRSLREDDGDAVLSYSRAFLKASDLAHVAANQRPILVQHLLARLSDGVSHEALEQVSGLARFLTDSDVNGWMDPLVKAFLSPASSKSLKDAMRRQILESAGSNSSSVDARIDLRLDAWVKAFNERGNTGDAALITSLKDELESERLPF